MKTRFSESFVSCEAALHDLNSWIVFPSIHQFADKAASLCSAQPASGRMPWIVRLGAPWELHRLPKRNAINCGQGCIASCWGSWADSAQRACACDIVNFSVGCSLVCAGAACFQRLWAASALYV